MQGGMTRHFLGVHPSQGFSFFFGNSHKIRYIT
jgi:hypothetical protein